jgi:hypothetical protein
MGMRPKVTLVAAAVFLALLAGCGSDAPRDKASDESGGTSAYPAPLVTEDGELLVTCGGDTGFPVSLLPDGLPHVLTQDQAVEIFTDLLSDPELAGELSLTFLHDGAQGTEWRVLRNDGDAYTLGLGHWTADGPAKDAYVMGVQRHDDGWAFGGGGTCNLEPQLEGDNIWVSLTLSAQGLDRESTSPTVGVTERECTSGRDPTPYLHDPVVVEGDDAVTVYWTSTPMTGDANCIGPAPTEVPLELDEPLGDRELLDGSSYPPAPIPDSLFG